jgi:serine protease inhibitor
MSNMKRIISHVCLIALTLVSYSVFGMAASNTGDTTHLVQGNNAFAFDLLHKVATTPGNVFFSPFSISSALAMTYAGAAGQTAVEMEQALHFHMTPKCLHAAFSRLNDALNAPNQSYQLTVANALWGQTGTAFTPAFLATANRYYDAALHEVDFATQPESSRLNINQWVEQRTSGKIKDLIKPGMISPLTRLILTNAICFKGDWEQAFDPKRTQTAPFYVTAARQVSVPMMQRSGRFLYTETDQFQILQLPYKGDTLAMNILLPHPDADWNQVIAQLQPEYFADWMTQLRYQTVHVSVPRFKLETELILREPLQNMGMMTAFNPYEADFSGLSQERLGITDIIHKAYIDVYEEGTEAAAATGIIVGTTSLGPPPIVFRADHPFVFLIRDTRSGSILFLGTLYNPS